MTASDIFIHWLALNHLRNSTPKNISLLSCVCDQPSGYGTYLFAVALPVTIMSNTAISARW